MLCVFLYVDMLLLLSGGFAASWAGVGCLVGLCCAVLCCAVWQAASAAAGALAAAEARCAALEAQLAEAAAAREEEKRRKAGDREALASGAAAKEQVRDAGLVSAARWVEGVHVEEGCAGVGETRSGVTEYDCYERGL